MPRVRQLFGLSVKLRHRGSMKYAAFDSVVCVEKARLATVTARFPRAADFVLLL